MFANRVKELAKSLRTRGIAAAAILPSAGLYYLTGMSAKLSERPMLFVFTADGASYAVCPSFESERVRRDSGVTSLFVYTDEEGAQAGFTRLFEAVGELSKVAMEYQAARVLEYMYLSQACRVQDVVDLRLILAEQRMRKDPKELNYMQQAAAQADALMGVVEA
ncbi:MAG: aminopeptidase P family N-terminal domain-containing protein, partial [bacterium]|nr:aminopeptidase P family N-terminal domain-containing protein [bacterium]